MPQDHPNEELYEKAVHILETYFDIDDAGEDQNLAPAITAGGYAFGAPAVGGPAGLVGPGGVPLQPGGFNFAPAGDASTTVTGLGSAAPVFNFAQPPQ